METQIRVLSEDEKAQVHERTLTVLGTVGMRCDTEEGRRRKFYKLTAAGKKELAAKREGWERFVAGVEGVLRGVSSAG